MKRACDINDIGFAPKHQFLSFLSKTYQVSSPRVKATGAPHAAVGGTTLTTQAYGRCAPLL